MGLAEDEIEDMVARASRGDSEDEIKRLLGVVDRWLTRMGMAPAPDTSGMG